MAQGANSRRAARRHAHLVGPVVLITVGVLLLMTNVGALPAGVWGAVWQLWPVVIILLGLEQLLLGRASWLRALVVILVLLVVVSVVASIPVGVDRSPGDRAPIVGMSFSQPLLDAQRADVHVNHGAGPLSIGSGAPEGTLAEGSLSSSTERSLARTYLVQDGVGVLTLSLQGQEQWVWRPGQSSATDDLSLRLNREIPIRRLEINTGAAETNLDLRALRGDSLDLNTGASRTHLWMPEHGQVSATIDAGAASIIVEIPREMAARIRVDGGLTGVEVDPRFVTVRSDGIPGLAGQREYQTADYDTAEHRVDLRISAGAASTEIK